MVILVLLLFVIVDVAENLQLHLFGNGSGKHSFAVNDIVSFKFLLSLYLLSRHFFFLLGWFCGARASLRSLQI